MPGLNRTETMETLCRAARPPQADRPISVAVVGLSDDPRRPSYRVAAALQRMGYAIVPVNPYVHDVLGRRAYPDLASVPAPVDVVLVFRRAEYTPDVARQAAAEKDRLGTSVLWLQEGIVSEEAARIALAAGLDVVMDRCMYKEAAGRQRCEDGPGTVR